jgi:hypothetical protein
MNGENTSAGLGHSMMFGKGLAVGADYTWDQETADVAWWAYRGNRVALNAIAELTSDYRLLLSASYCDRKYDGRQPGTAEARHDGVQEYTAGITRRLGKNAGITLTEDYIINDSNLSYYKYTRNIAGILVEWKL